MSLTNGGSYVAPCKSLQIVSGRPLIPRPFTRVAPTKRKFVDCNHTPQPTHNRSNNRRRPTRPLLPDSHRERDVVRRRNRRSFRTPSHALEPVCWSECAAKPSQETDVYTHATCLNFCEHLSYQLHVFTCVCFCLCVYKALCVSFSLFLSPFQRP